MEAEIERVLKLQQDYDRLLHDVQQLTLMLYDYEEQGICRSSFHSDTEEINLCNKCILRAIKDGRYIRKKQKNGRDN